MRLQNRREGFIRDGWPAGVATHSIASQVKLVVDLPHHLGGCGALLIRLLEAIVDALDVVLELPATVLRLGAVKLQERFVDEVVKQLEQLFILQNIALVRLM